MWSLITSLAIFTFFGFYFFCILGEKEDKGQFTVNLSILTKPKKIRNNLVKSDF